MSDTATLLLATFNSLPEKEQHELLIAMLRRSGELPGTMVSDEQLLVIADELFQSLDAELTALVPHTTSTRNSRFEIRTNVRFLKPEAFDAQNIITIPTVKLIRRLGTLPDEQMAQVEGAVKLWLGFETA